jgi:hypothetical protein
VVLALPVDLNVKVYFQKIAEFSQFSKLAEFRDFFKYTFKFSSKGKFNTIDGSAMVALYKKSRPQSVNKRPLWGSPIWGGGEKPDELYGASKGS